MSAVTTDREITIASGVKIGISQSLDNYTLEEITDFHYCASSFPEFVHYSQNGDNDERYYITPSTAVNTDTLDVTAPLTIRSVINGGYNGWFGKMSGGNISDYINPDGIDVRVFFMYGTSFENLSNMSITQGHSAGVYIITQLDPLQWRVRYENMQDSVNDYATDTGGVRRVKLEFKDNNNQWNSRTDIRPVVVFTIGDKTFISANLTCPINNDYRFNRVSTSATGYLFGVNSACGHKSYDNTVGLSFIANLGRERISVYETAYIETGEQINLSSNDYLEYNTYVSDIDGFCAFVTNKANCDLLYCWYGESGIDYMSRFGLYIYDDRTQKTYKPIIENGWTVGYSDDLNAVSDIDNYTYDSTMKHDIAPTKPKRETENDGIDDMAFNKNDMFVNGMVDYYLTPYGGLDAISNGISSDTKYTGVSENIVSLMGFYINPSLFSNGISVSGFNVGKLSIPYGNAIKLNVLKPVLLLGNKKIDGRHGTLQKPHFLDYAPYTKLELYIPFCGTIDLPPRVMYNTINVYLLGDIITGGCLGVVKCNGEIVATKSGMIGRTIPMTFNASAEQTQAMLQGVMNGVAIGGQVLLSGATNNIVGMVSGTMSGIANISQQIQAGNKNYTHHIGTTGGIIEGAMPEQCYLRRIGCGDKSSDKYNSTYGRPCCKTKTISSGDGFTVIDNPKIAGNMTASEKSRLESIYSSGVIL